jgi:hypothetical protein
VTVPPFLAALLLIAVRAPGGSPIFHSTIRDRLRLFLFGPALRVMTIPSYIRYTFLGTVRSSVVVIEQLVCMLLLSYVYAVVGCQIFGGRFTFVTAYSTPLMNFNSMTDALLTLYAYFFSGVVAEVVWVACAVINPYAGIFFFVSFTIILQIIFSNLLISTMCRWVPERACHRTGRPGFCCCCLRGTAVLISKRGLTSICVSRDGTGCTRRQPHSSGGSSTPRSATCSFPGGWITTPRMTRRMNDTPSSRTHGIPPRDIEPRSSSRRDRGCQSQRSRWSQARLRQVQQHGIIGERSRRRCRLRKPSACGSL